MLGYQINSHRKVSVACQCWSLFMVLCLTITATTAWSILQNYQLEYLKKILWQLVFILSHLPATVMWCFFPCIFIFLFRLHVRNAIILWCSTQSHSFESFFLQFQTFYGEKTIWRNPAETLKLQDEEAKWQTLSFPKFNDERLEENNSWPGIAPWNSSLDGYPKPTCDVVITGQ